MPFKFIPTPIDGVVIVESQIFGDERGQFFESFKASDFVDNGLPQNFTQGNQSTSVAGVLRGIHFQTSPCEQGKLVSVASGAVFDVAVDLRVGSPTFAQWYGTNLVAQDGRSLWIPPGFGHGFCVLGDSPATLSYLVTGEYSPAHDSGIIWNDPDIAIKWPINGDLGGNPILSDKDRGLASLASHSLFGKAS